MGSKWHDWSRYDSTIRKMHRDGKPYTEIAKHLGLPKDTIYEHCRGALGFKKEKDMIEEKLVYSVSEVGQLLGVSRPKVYDLTNRSDFPVVQVGRRKLIPKKEFEEWLSRETKHTRT